jgi:hypothetical protein
MGIDEREFWNTNRGGANSAEGREGHRIARPKFATLGAVRAFAVDRSHPANRLE